MMLTRGLTPGACWARLDLAFLGAELGPEPVDGAIGGLPLVFVDGAGDEAQQVAAFGRDTAADHLGDAAGDDDGRQILVAGGGGAAHGTLGAVHRKIVFGKACNGDRQFMRRKAIGVMQNGGDGEVFAADRAIDQNAQAAHGGEGVNGAPVAAGSVVVEHKHWSVLHRGRKNVLF